MKFNLNFFIFILSIIIIFILLHFHSSSSNNNYQSKYHNAIKTIVRQAARWTTASLQDENPMIAILHANYGAGYLWALLDIADSAEIEKIAQINLQKFRLAITSAQDKASQKMNKICPNFGPRTTYLTKIAGEE